MPEPRTSFAWLTWRGALRVPEVTAYFWVIKALSTAMGESTSDYSVHAIDPVIAVLLGFCGFVVALALQFSVQRYIAWTYWLAVVGVGVFGTMAADVLHVRFGVPYAVSTILYASLLALVFVVAADRAHALVPYDRHTPARGLLLGGGGRDVRDGDGARRPDRDHVRARLLRLRDPVRVRDRDPGDRLSVVRLERDLRVLVRVRGDPPARRLVRRLAWQAASVGGLGLGDGRVALVLTLMIVALVAYLALTGRDVQQSATAANEQVGVAEAGTLEANL